MAITLREGLGRKLTIAEMDENFTFLSSSYVVNSITGSMTAASSSVAARATLLSADATASFADLASDARTSDSSSVAARATLLSADATASFADLASTVHDGNITTAKIANSNVTNAKLQNDSITFGTTAQALGSTVTSISGLTSISATTGSFVLQVFESASTIITSGSNIFGDKQDDIQQITGSLTQTGSFVLSGSLLQSHGTISGSFEGDGTNLTGISSFAVANSADNRVLTSVDASNGNAEANLTFDGSTLTVAGTINETSARRFKENIVSLEDSLSKTLQLNPIEYDWIKDGKHDIGLIAEEVNEILPDLVHKEDGEIQGIHYSRLTAILIGAVKELTARVEELESK